MRSVKIKGLTPLRWNKCVKRYITIIYPLAVFMVTGVFHIARAVDTGGFVILEDSNKFIASPGVPESAIQILQSAQNRKTEIKSVAFTSAGEWTILTDNGFDASDDVLGAYAHLKGAKQVAFSAAGPWLILYQKGFWGPGSAAWSKVHELANAGHDIQSVAFGPAESYVIVLDKTNTIYKDVPIELAKVIENANSNNIAIRCVAFRGLDWVCLARDTWWASDTNLPPVKLIDQEYKSGQHPRLVAFVPTLGPFNPRKFGAMIRKGFAGKLAGGYACEVIDHGKIVVALAEGWARAPWEPKDPSVKWTMQKPMEIASVSKTITATALLKLWEESASTPRRFSLDDPFWPQLKKICPDANDAVKQITMRQLLLHRSGFTNNPFNGHDRRGLADVRQLLSMPLAHQPGTFSEYQNMNYSILRFLIEQISNENYTDYVKTHVLAPMGITDMDTHSETYQRTCSYFKPGRQTSGDGWPNDLTSTAGSYGWFASAADLGKFLEGLRLNIVLSPATTAIMFKEKMGWDHDSPLVKWGIDLTGHGQFRSGILYANDGIEAVILVNCQPASPDIGIDQAWRDARY